MDAASEGGVGRGLGGGVRALRLRFVRREAKKAYVGKSITVRPLDLPTCSHSVLGMGDAFGESTHRR